MEYIRLFLRKQRTIVKLPSAGLTIGKRIKIFLSIFRLSTSTAEDVGSKDDGEVGTFSCNQSTVVLFSVHLSVCFSVCLPVCLPACRDCLAVVHVCLPACLSACLPVCLSICLPAFMSVPVSVSVSVCFFVCLSVCLCTVGSHGSNGNRKTSVSLP